MKIVKRVFGAIVLTIIMLGILSSVVFAYTYYAAIQAQETGGNSYTYVPFIVDVDNDYLVDNNYIAATGLDTRVTAGGTALQHLVVDDSVVFVIPSLSANSLGNYRYELGESALSDMPVITGYGGYVTISDDADLEPGDDFEIEFDGYIDTSSGSGKNLVYKQDATRVWVSEEGAIQASISLPTTASDTLKYSSDSAEYTTSTSYVLLKEITLTEYLTIVRVKFDLMAQYEDETAFGKVYKNDVAIGSQQTNSLASYVTKSEDITLSATVGDKIQVYGHGTGGYRCYVKNFRIYYDGGGELSATVTDISSGEHTVKAYADGTDLGIIVDEGEAGEVSDTTALSGASVPDNANDIIINQNNVMPYFDYLKWTVSDTLIAWYQPVTIIADEVLPDRQGADENGAITWGSNPDDTSISIGQLISASQPSPGLAGGDESQDILPGIAQPNGMFEMEDMSDHPFYEAVVIVSDVTGFSEEQLWFGAASMIVLGAMVFAIVRFRGHLVVAGIVGFALAGLMRAQGIYPWWVLFIFAAFFIVSILMERKPVV